MRYPKLVKKSAAKTPIRIVIDTEDVDRDGAPVTAFDTGEILCNWQDGGKVELTGEQKYVRITGTALIDGDICPSVPVIASGYGILFGEKRQIAEGIKARNPDGTVNYTEVRFK